MKKIFAFLAACAITVSSFGVIALADEETNNTGATPEPEAVETTLEPETVQATAEPAPEAPADPNAVTVLINGVELKADVPAQIIGDRTMVPMRAIFESLGANVTWIPENQSIFATQGPTLVVMRIGVNTLAVSTIGADSKSVELDVPPQIVNDRTLVPVRAISEALGCKVDWDGDTRTVTITK